MRPPSVPAIFSVWFLAILVRAGGDPPAPSAAPQTPPCPFCALASAEIVAVDESGLAFRDAHPASAGHTLVIPRRHVSSFRDLSADEWSAIGRLGQRLAGELQAADPSITGFNFGVNDGADAGQSVPHCHFHLIPRRTGDTPNPRGGIRKAISVRSDPPPQP